MNALQASQPKQQILLPQHSFYLPVMGLAFTIDSPLKVAQYGISSAISIMEDRLIETMRRHYYKVIGEPCMPILAKEPDSRERRITDYLNLANRIIAAQVERLKKSLFEKGSDLVKYFELLPPSSELKKLYQQMQATDNTESKSLLEAHLKNNITPGSIDVNIMTKLDKNNYTKEGTIIQDGSDAITALKGFAKSELKHASVIFSAGLNPRLFNYLEKCREFDAKEDGAFEKKVVIKVSDYRSALIQGKYLAKKGIWVSEFRIESGLNCGGHAFATDGHLMGPILEEFKQNRRQLQSTLFEMYTRALTEKALPVFHKSAPPLTIAVQGGIGTYEECTLLHKYYGVERTGWGTPFLLVPEATLVDAPTLRLLQQAKAPDVILSNNSPLGVPFYYLKGTSSDIEKKSRIARGRPGSPCTEKHLVSNTEFTKEPICTASARYQKLKLHQLSTLNLPDAQYQKARSAVLDKECLCIGLSNPAAIRYEQPFLKNLEAVTICPGPNIAYFTKTVSLQTMTDHIYGRCNIIADSQRPHVFIGELLLYIQYLNNQLSAQEISLDKKKIRYFLNFYQQLHGGIAYYRHQASTAYGFTTAQRTSFLQHLDTADNQLEMINQQLLEPLQKLPDCIQ